MRSDIWSAVRTDEPRRGSDFSEGDERGDSAQYGIEFDAATNEDCQYPQAAKHAGGDEGDCLYVLRQYVKAEAGGGQCQGQKQPGGLVHGMLR